MRIDVNAFLGAYPWSRVPGTTPTALLAAMDRVAIDSAWVTHLPGLFWRDPTEGNPWLYETCRTLPRLRPVPAVHPGLAHWQAESYAGVPLCDSAATIVGHLAIIDDKPMPDGVRALEIMRIFATRAGAELERLRVDAALRDSEQRLSRVIESAMDGIVTMDAGRRLVLFNTAAEKIFGCSAAAAIGQPLDRFLTAGFRRALDRSLETLHGGGQAQRYVWAPEGLTARSADGREFPIEATISHVSVGGRTLYTLILRDVDERRQAEAQLRRLHLQNEYLQEEIRSVHNVDEIVGQSAALHDALEKVRLVGDTDSSVLILGETGTGRSSSRAPSTRAAGAKTGRSSRSTAQRCRRA